MIKEFNGALSNKQFIKGKCQFPVKSKRSRERIV